MVSLARDSELNEVYVPADMRSEEPLTPFDRAEAAPPQASLFEDRGRGRYCFGLAGIYRCRPAGHGRDGDPAHRELTAGVAHRGANPFAGLLVNLAPADIRKEGPSFDLPMAVGLVLASEQIVADTSKALFLGELSLDGRLRARISPRSAARSTSNGRLK